MRKYAALHGFTIITEISDEVSGTVSLRERSGGQQLYSYLDRKAVDVVIFHRLDRITRDEDLIEIHIARRDIRNANAELHFADGGKTDLSMWGSAIDHIKALGAAEERLKIKARSIGGRQAKAKSGAWVGQGEPPYGYNRDGHGKASKLVINEAEAAIVKRIFDLYTGNNGNPPVALKAICVLLTDEGVPVPSTTKPHPRIGRYWQKRLVQIILSRVIYIGKMQYGDIITDAQLAATAADKKGGAVIAFTNPGGIRADIVKRDNGDVTYADVFAAQPFRNQLVTMTLTGRQIKDALEQQWADPKRPRILQASREFSFAWDGSKGPGERILAARMTLNGSPIDPAARYRVTVNNYLSVGGDGFTVFTEGTDQVTGVYDVDALYDYFLKHSPIGPAAGGRIARID